MAKVKYIGKKMVRGVPSKGIQLPVGVKHQSNVAEVKIANPFCEIPDAEAKKLLELCPGQFEIVESSEVVSVAPKKRKQKLEKRVDESLSV